MSNQDVAEIRRLAELAMTQATNPGLAILTLTDALRKAADEIEAQGRIIADLVERPT